MDDVEEETKIDEEPAKKRMTRTLDKREINASLKTSLKSSNVVIKISPKST